MRLSHRTATAALAVVLLSACGSGDGSGTSDAVDVVQAAAGTSQQESARLSLENTTEVGGQTITVTGSGVVDPARDLAAFDFEVPGLPGIGSGMSFELRQVGERVFLQLPQQGELFYELSLEDLGGTSFGAAGDPSSLLQALEAAGDVEQVGEEQVDGVATTHYRGSYDLEAALEASTGQAREALEALQGAGGDQLRRLPFDVFVDDDGRVRRFEQELALPVSEATGGQAVTVRTVLELSDFGVEVDVEAPPADQVQDGAALQELLGGGAAAPG